MSSYNSKWQEVTTKILERLKFDLQATDIFPKENVKILGAFAQWKAKYDQYPNCLIRFEALRDDNTLDGNCDWLLIREKDLTYGWSEGYLFYECLMNVEVHATW
ncbi:MAG: hypothetical protein ACTSPB_26520 [Candidatus Thorarchaeota archaeon]